MALLRLFENSLIARHVLSRLQRASPKDVIIVFLLTSAVLVTAHYLSRLAYSLLFSPLRKIPGPLLARVTRWWEYRMVLNGDSNLEFIRLHKKHGSCSLILERPRT